MFQKGESSCYNRIFKVGDSQKFITFPAIHQISRHETFHCQIDKALQNKTIYLEQDKFNRQTQRTLALDLNILSANGENINTYFYALRYLKYFKISEIPS